MGAVSWTPTASADLEAICGYIACDSPRLADSFGERIVSAVERLADFPRSGRVVPEFDRDDIRELIAGQYRIVYRVSGEDAQILTVRHGARLLRAADLG